MKTVAAAEDVAPELAEEVMLDAMAGYPIDKIADNLDISPLLVTRILQRPEAQMRLDNLRRAIEGAMFKLPVSWAVATARPEPVSFVGPDAGDNVIDLAPHLPGRR